MARSWKDEAWSVNNGEIGGMLVFYLNYDFLLCKLAWIILQPQVFSFNICLKVVEQSLQNNVLVPLKFGEIRIRNHLIQQ